MAGSGWGSPGTPRTNPGHHASKVASRRGRHGRQVTARCVQQHKAGRLGAGNTELDPAGGCELEAHAPASSAVGRAAPTCDMKSWKPPKMMLNTQYLQSTQ